MKKLSFLSIIVFALCFSCKEIQPVIPPFGDGGGSVIVTPESRKVLIEEFTGVSCVNCPQGAAQIEDLISIHGESLIAISIHAGFFSSPYPGQQDFRTEEGSAILNLLGGESSYPAGVINRKIFDGEIDHQVGQASWAGHIANELTEDAKVTIDISTNYNSETRKLDIDVTGGAIEIIDGALRISVMVVETNIKDKQLTPDGLIDDYSHKHVLRDMLTDATGDELALEGLAVNETYEKSYSMVLPEAWESGNCSVVAFVHETGTTTTVLQAEEHYLGE